MGAPFSFILPHLGRRALVVVSLGDPRSVLSDARRAARDGADILELRGDAFSPDELTPGALGPVCRRVRAAGKRPLLLTLRSAREGGGWPASLSEKHRAALMTALLPRVDGVDVELSSPRTAAAVVRAARRKKKWVILSSHDFSGVPSPRRLAALARRARRWGGDFLKIAVTPRDRRAAEEFMDRASRLPFPQKILIAMGRAGRFSRVEGFRWDSLLTYGYVGRPTAPGQVSVKALAGSCSVFD
jgi:3-dehydroquinate dehydratase-1